MMAAKGMVPLPPRDMVVVMCGLTLDGNAQLAEAARAGLTKLPDKILGPALDGDLPPAALGVLVQALAGREELLEKLVLNRATPDEALADLILTCSERLAEIIAGNQERCLRSERLVRAIPQSQSLLRSSRDRVFDFLVRSGVIHDNMPEFAEALSRLSPTEMQDMANNVQLPSEVAGLLDEGTAVAAPPVAAEVVGLAEAAAGAAGEGEAEGEKDEEEEPGRVPMAKLINGLNAAQKVALALKGNREARAILIRDSNRVVATAVIKSPRITEQEVVAAAKSRSVSDEIIRIIANSKEMSRSYGVKVALVNNPKTPLQTATKYLSLLRQNDLKAIAKSKSVPSALATQAKRMLTNKAGAD
jgi:hypothetical protein